jgi:hypothetical protein
MRVKTSPNPISLPPSTPPRFGPRGPSFWAVGLLGMLSASELAGQAVALSAAKYGVDYAASASLWFGVQPDLYGAVSYSTGPWISDRYVFSRYVDEHRGRGRGHFIGRGRGHNKRLDCRDLFWDPWAWSWAGCGPHWRSAYWYSPYGWVPAVPVWAPFGVYVGVPIHHKFRRTRPYYAYSERYDDDHDDYYYYDDDYDDYGYSDYHDDGWSIDVQVSIGLGHGGSYLRPWYHDYAGWGPVYVSPWFDPWPQRHTIVYVDPGPRWVVRTQPRYVRAEPSRRIGSGGWVSQVGFKESPQGSTPPRTAMARPSRDASGVSRDRVSLPPVSLSPSRAAAPEPRAAAEPRVGRARVSDVARPETRVREAQPGGATRTAPSRAEPEPVRARARVEGPRDAGPSAAVREPRATSGRVLLAPSASIERRRPEAAVAPSRGQVEAEPRARPERQARPEPQIRAVPQVGAEPQMRAEPRARAERQAQVRAEPRARAERQPSVRAEPRAQPAPRSRDAAPQASPSRESRNAAPRVESQRESRNVRPQGAPPAAREPRLSRPQASAAPTRVGREPQGAASRQSQRAGPSAARVRPSR